MKEFKKVYSKNLILILAAINFIFCPLAFADSEVDMASDYLVEIGKDLFKKGNLEEAQHELKKALMVNPNNKEAIYYLKLLEPEYFQTGPVSPAKEQAKEQAKEPVKELERDIIIDNEFSLLEQGTEEQEAVSTAPVKEPSPQEEQVAEQEAVSTAPVEKEGKSGKFLSYVVEKSQEELQQEVTARELNIRATAIPEKPATIPEKARPSVELAGVASYDFIKYHLHPRFQDSFYSLAGRAFDWNLRFETNYKQLGTSFDHDYTYLDLYKPGMFIGLFGHSIALPHIRMQSEDFYGLDVIKSWDKAETTFVGGQTENFFSGGTGTVKYLGKMYGLKQYMSVSDWLDIGGAAFFLENKSESKALSGTTSFPRDNTIGFAEAKVKLSPEWDVSGQLAECNYNPDNSPNTLTQDLDWRLASELRKERYRLGAEYEFVGDKYSSLGNPLSYQDYNGGDIYGGYQVSDKWRISGSLIRYNNNVSDDPNRPTQSNQGVSLSSNYILTQEQNLSLTYSYFNTHTASATDSDTDSMSSLYRIDYSFPLFFGTRGLVGYQLFSSEFSDPNANDFIQQTPSVSLFKSFGRASNWYLSYLFDKTNFDEGQDTQNSAISFNINYVASDRTTLYFNTFYNRDITGEIRPGNNISASSGFNYRASPQTTLNCEYNIGNFDLNTQKHKWPPDWSLLARIRQGFDFSTPPNYGIIQGAVFSDLNANGKLDKDERGLADVRLYLEDKREAFTDSAGHYKFSYITPEKQKVYLDLGSVPADWAVAKVVQEADVLPRRKSKIDFAVVKGSTIEGKVFVDENANKTYEPNEEPLENVAIILNSGEQFRRTNSDGEYKFENLLPGKYKISINTRDIPLGYQKASADEKDLEVGIGTKTEDVNFLLSLGNASVKKF